MIKKELKRKLDFSDKSRAKKEIILSKQSGLLEFYRKEVEKLQLCKNDYEMRMLQLQHDRLTSQRLVMSYLFLESFMAPKKCKWTNRIKGYSGTLIDSMYKHSITNELVEINALLWTVRTYTTYVAAHNLLPPVGAVNTAYQQLFNHLQSGSIPDNYNIIVLVNLLQLNQMLCTRIVGYAEIHKEEQTPHFLQLVMHMGKCIILSFAAAYSSNSVQVTVLIKALFKSLSKYLLLDSVINRRLNDVRIWGDGYSDEGLIADVLYWVNCLVYSRSLYMSNHYLNTYIINNRHIQQQQRHKLMHLDTCDTRVGAGLCTDLLACCEYITLYMAEAIAQMPLEGRGVSLLTSFQVIYTSRYFKVLYDFTCASCVLSASSVDSYVIALQGFDANERNIKVAGAGEEEAPSDKKRIDDCETRLILSALGAGDYTMIPAADDEVTAGYRYITASFATGIMTTAAACALNQCMKLVPRRRAYYFLSISMLEALLSACMCVISKGTGEDEFEMFKHKISVPVPIVSANAKSSSSGRRTRQQQTIDDDDNLTDDDEGHGDAESEDTDKEVDFVEEQVEPPRPMIMSLMARVSSLVLLVMSNHRMSLSIQHAGLMLLRLLIRSSFMARAAVESLLSPGVVDENAPIKEDAVADDEADGEDLISVADTISLKTKASHMSQDSNGQDKNIKEQFYVWYRNVTSNSHKECEIFLPRPYDLIHTMQYIGEVHISSLDLMEQLMLLILQLSKSTSIAVLAMMDVNMPVLVERIMNMMPQDEVYVRTLASMFLDIVKNFL